MGTPTTIPCAKGEWTKIGSAVANLEAYNAVTRAKYYMIYVPFNDTAPTDLTNAAPIFVKSDKLEVKTGGLVDVYVWAINIAGSLVVYNNTGVNQNTTLFNRPLTTNGLPNGTVQMNVNGSVTPVNFYAEALAGERLAVSRFIITIRSTTTIDVNQYGDQAALTNGLILYFYDKHLDLTFNLISPLSIKTNEDWGRWCFDSVPIPVGATNKTNTWQARWTLTKYGNPYGLVMEEGDRVGVTVSDNLTGLVGHTIIAEGLHLGTPSASWFSLI